MKPQTEPILLEEHVMGDMLFWARKGHEKNRPLDAIEKISAEKLERVLTEQANNKAQECWAAGCNRHPKTWVREVQFDMKESTWAEPVYRQVTSADYTGPIPGFCWAHIGNGPTQLAEAVYFSRPEMQWGLKPNRWFVIFTDGTKQGGECLSLDPHQIQPKFVEELETHAN